MGVVEWQLVSVWWIGNMVWVWRSGNWYGCGGVAIGMGVIDWQLVWVWWSDNRYQYGGLAIWCGCGGVAIGMGVMEKRWEGNLK